MPTLLDMLRITPPDGVQGASLLAAISAPDGQPDLVALSETYFAPKQRLVAASDGHYKLIASLDAQGDQLFDLREDPAETENLISSRPEVVARLREAVDRYVNERGPSGSEDSGRPIDPAIRERLRVLGYSN